MPHGQCHSGDPTPPAQEPPGVGCLPSHPPALQKNCLSFIKSSIPEVLSTLGAGWGRDFQCGISKQGRTPLPALRPWASGPCDTRLQAALHSFPWPPAQAAASARTGRARPASPSSARSRAAHPPMPTMYFISAAEGQRGPRLADDSLTPGARLGPTPQCVSFIETPRLYRLGQHREVPRVGRPTAYGERGCALKWAGGVGVARGTCSHWMEIAPRCPFA